MEKMNPILKKNRGNDLEIKEIFTDEKFLKFFKKRLNVKKFAIKHEKIAEEILSLVEIIKNNSKGNLEKLPCSSNKAAKELIILAEIHSRIKESDYIFASRDYQKKEKYYAGIYALLYWYCFFFINKSRGESKKAYQEVAIYLLERYSRFIESDSFEKLNQEFPIEKITAIFTNYGKYQLNFEKTNIVISQGKKIKKIGDFLNSEIFPKVDVNFGKNPFWGIIFLFEEFIIKNDLNSNPFKVVETRGEAVSMLLPYLVLTYLDYEKSKWTSSYAAKNFKFELWQDMKNYKKFSTSDKFEKNIKELLLRERFIDRKGRLLFTKSDAMVSRVIEFLRKKLRKDFFEEKVKKMKEESFNKIIDEIRKKEINDFITRIEELENPGDEKKGKIHKVIKGEIHSALNKFVRQKGNEKLIASLPVDDFFRQNAVVEENTQALAKFIGISTTTMKKIFGHKKRSSKRGIAFFNIVIKIAVTYDLSPEGLLGLDGIDDPYLHPNGLKTPFEKFSDDCKMSDSSAT